MHDAQALLSDAALGLVRERRPSQLRMAAHVEHVLNEGGAAFVEAGVATGKTFAYLLPALLAQGRRIVVATAKKQLQDQIIGKDLPAIAAVLGESIKTLLVDHNGVPQMLATPLKGKGNYTCRSLGIPLAKRDPDGLYDYFLTASKYGDRADYPGYVPRWWGGATAEECVGKRCPQADDCGFIRVKRESTQSKIVVVNHHVLGAEMFYGLGKLVGGTYDVLIVDEAHKLADGIRAAFTNRVAEDSIESLVALLARTGTAFPMVKRLVAPWTAMFAGVPNRHWRDPALREIPAFGDDQLVDDVLGALGASLGEIDKTLSLFGDDDSMMEASMQHDLALMNQAKRRLDGLERGVRIGQGRISPKEDEDGMEFEQRREKLLANTAVYGSQDRQGTVQLFCAPIELGGIAKTYLSQIRTTVLCSATLAINGGFDHINRMTGLTPAVTDVLPSPFDYDKQGFVYVPRDLPVVPRTADNYAAVGAERVNRICRLVALSDGGAFILTTANDELDAIATALKQRFPGRTFAQGHTKNQWDGDPQSVLTQYLGVPNAILVGSKSFWEGVDVVGGQLRLVIVAKLPFPQYGDPIIKARERVAENPFRDVQMTDMLTDLRQGVGRLIRSKDDRGCVAILDSRVWTKSYGGAALSALPWSRDVVTSDLSVVEKYLPKYAAYFNRKVA